MARKNLTARFVETVKVEARTDFWDDVERGLVLRVSKTGVKSWTVVYVRESDGSKRRVTLGQFPAVTLEKARTKALKAKTAISDGGDPAGDKRARREAMTVEDLGALYVAKYAKRHKKTWAEDERLLKVDVYPEIGKTKAVALKRRDLLDIIEAKAEAGYLAQSRQVLAVIRKMLNWAVASDYLETSPAAGIKPLAKATKRDRVLSDAEVKVIWNALPGAAISPKTADIIRLLFLTGQRSGEVCGMMRSEIDLENAIWALPKARTKNGLAHMVPLSAMALAIIKANVRPADEEDGEDYPLFSRIGEPIEPNAIAHAVRLKLQVAADKWTPHDARRTTATGMADLGIAPHIIEATLNHISGFKAGVAGVYNKAQYEPEKRAALKAWAAHIDRVITDAKAKKAANVVQFRGR